MEVWIRVGGVGPALTVSGGAGLERPPSCSLLGGGQLLVKGPEDSDEDTTLQSHVTVTQVDVDSSATAQKVIDGTPIHVDIEAVGGA